MASSITSLVQTVTVSEVQDIIVTEVVADGDSNYVRAIRIYGTLGNTAPALEIRITSSDASKLKITLPSVDI